MCCTFPYIIVSKYERGNESVRTGTTSTTNKSIVTISVYETMAQFRH